MRIAFLVLALLVSRVALSQERVSRAELVQNFGIVYGTQWATYLITQRSIIEKSGSLKNWIHNPSSPHFDNDSFDYNIFQHSLSGSAYYLFYRSQKYRKVDALLWSGISSAAFEFTVETVTERPSWQDLYQTPVYGSLLGMGLETLSDKAHGTGSWWGKTLAIVLNPFRLLKKEDEEEKSALLPVLAPERIGLLYTREF